MSENEQDPGASTEMFRAFVADRQETSQRSPSRSPLVIAAAVALVVVAAVVGWLLLG